jgi:hypothetical protein
MARIARVNIERRLVAARRSGGMGEDTNVDPSRQWQQPDPSGGYGQTPPGGYPPQPPYGQPQQPQYPPQYPQQPQYPQPQQQPPQYPQPQPQQPQQPRYPQPQYPPPAPAPQPYSAVPYATPYSAPPAYQPAPQSGPPFQPSAPMPAPPAKRSRWMVPLIISSAVLVILVVAIVVVVFNRKPDSPSTPTAGGSQGPVDSCLVGKWKQTSYQHYVDLTDTDVGKREGLGKIKFTGGGKVWEIRDDGNAIEDDTKTVYSGKTDDGKTVNASWEGRTEWKLTTKDGILSFAGGEATTVVTISVDGAAKGRIELEPNLDPMPYTCNGDIWRTSGKDSANDFARYDREK